MSLDSLLCTPQFIRCHVCYYSSTIIIINIILIITLQLNMFNYEMVTSEAISALCQLARLSMVKGLYTYC